MSFKQVGLTFVAGAVGMLLAGTSSAAPTPQNATAPDPNTPAAVLIGDAVGEYDAGRYEEARALFRAAHEKAPTARTLRGIGMASFELRDYIEAARALSGALEDKRRALTDEQRQQVQQLLARTETFVGRFALRLQPADAGLLVDGKVAAREADGTLLLSFGRHRLTARCASCLPSEKDLDLDVIGGEHREIEISLTTAPAAVLTPKPASQEAGGSPPPMIEKRETGATGDSAPYWWGGVAVASLLGATAGALYWINRGNELDACRLAADRCKNDSTLTGERNLAIGMTVGFGAVAITTGIIAAVVKQRGATTSTVACGAGKGTVSCAIRF